MKIKEIRYKGKIDFDYFEIWLGPSINIFDHDSYTITKEDVDADATCVSTQICPWCIRKYGLYNEVGNTPKNIEEEIKFYDKNFDPEDLGYKCGVGGCMNGAAENVDLDWKDFEITDYER